MTADGYVARLTLTPVVRASFAGHSTTRSYTTYWDTNQRRTERSFRRMLLPEQ
jgi:hypothetical protein